MYRLGHRRRGTAGQVQHQAGGVFDGSTRQRRVDATLEAVARIGVQAQLAAAAHDRGRREVRRFQEYSGGGIGDARIEAAHQAGQADRAVSIGNHQEAVVQRSVTAIQQLQAFIGARTTHTDRALQGAQIVGVHRLAQLKHHVLGDIDQQRYRAHTTAAQALGHPQRGLRRGVDTFDDTTKIARRFGTGVELDRQLTAATGGDRLCDEIQYFATRRCSNVISDAADAEAVGAVGSQLDLDAGVRQAEVLHQRLADRRVVRQFQQTGGIVVQAKLLGRAEHAVGFDAAQLGRLDLQLTDLRTDHRQRRDQAWARIRRTTDDLQQLSLPRINLAHLQAVGFGMALGFDDTRDDHVLQAVAKRGHVFHFQADGGQHRAELIARGSGRDVAAQPVFGEFHGVTLVGPAHAPGLRIQVQPGMARLYWLWLTRTASGTARRSRRTRAGR